MARGGHGDGQRQARQLAARGHLGQRARRAAGVAGHAQLDGFQAEGLRLVLRHQRHLESPAGHAQLLHGLGDRGRQRRRGRAARAADLLGLGLPGLLGALGNRAFQRFGSDGGIQRRELGAPLGQQCGSSAGVRR
jgi:hypothetical protein